MFQHDSLVTGIDWAPNTDRIVTCSQDRNAYVFNFEGGDWKPVLVILRLDRAATCVKWSPREDKFAVGTGSKAISVCYFDTDNSWWVSKHIRGDKSGITSTIKCLTWHPNNILLAAGGTDLKVHVFSTFIKGIDSRGDVASGTPFGSKLPWAKLCAEFPTSAWIHDIAFSPSGNQLAWVTHDSLVYFLDCAREDSHRIQTVKTSGLVCNLFNLYLFLFSLSKLLCGRANTPSLQLVMTPTLPSSKVVPTTIPSEDFWIKRRSRDPPLEVPVPRSCGNKDPI